MQKATLEYDLDKLDGLDAFMAAKNAQKYRAFIQSVLGYVGKLRDLEPVGGGEIKDEIKTLLSRHSLPEFGGRLQ